MGVWEGSKGLRRLQSLGQTPGRLLDLRDDITNV